MSIPIPTPLTPDAFWELCRTNLDVPLEQDADGTLIVLNRGGWEGAHLRTLLGFQLTSGNIAVGRPGYIADPSTGYQLPNKATRTPNASWTQRNRIDRLTPDERQRFAPLCPDFVAELMFSFNSLTATRAKMAEYRDNGARLGLLIDRGRRIVEVYRPEHDPQVLQDPASVACDPELPGFVLDMSRIF